MLEMLQRSEVSNPPAYGAKIASTILADATLREAWHDDLITMSSRIRSMRSELYDSLVSSGEHRLPAIDDQRSFNMTRRTWHLGAPDPPVRNVWISGTSPERRANASRFVLSLELLFL